MRSSSFRFTMKANYSPPEGLLTEIFHRFKAVPERTWRLALIAIYAAIHSSLFPHWELTGDDGHTLAAAGHALNSLYWFGPSSSLGVLHSSVVYYIYSVFLRLHDSFTSVQIGLLLSHLAAHWLLIEFARRIFSTPTAWLASLLAFTNPNFFVHYDQRFWEPALMPLFATLAWISLIELSRSGKWRFELTFLLALLAACSSHLASLFLLLPFSMVPRTEKYGPRDWAKSAVSACLIGLAASPYIAWMAGRFSQSLAYFVLVLMLLFSLSCVRRLILRLEIGRAHV